MKEVVLTCALASCGARFIPTRAQLGQRKRKRKSYCSPECCSAAAAEKSRSWWKTDRGREYARARYRAKRQAAIDRKLAKQPRPAGGAAR